MNIISNFTISYAIVISTIIQTFLPNSCIINIIEKYELNIPTYHQPIVKVSLDNLTPVELLEVIQSSSKIGCLDFIISVKDPVTFLGDIDVILRKTIVRKGNRTIIVIDSGYSASIFFDSKILKYYPNTILITRDTDIKDLNCTHFKILAQNYARNDNDSKFKILDLWNECEGKFKFGNNLFPNDMSNLNGNVLKLAVLDYKPYAILDLPDGSYDGTEIKVIKELCRWINCTIELVSDDGNEWGEIYENFTGIGALGKVAMDDADMCVGAMYMWHHEFLFLDFSNSVLRTGITCLAPAPTLITSWLLLFLPLSKNLWLLIGITFFMSTIVLLVIIRNKPNQVSSLIAMVLHQFGMITSQPLPPSYITRKTRKIIPWSLLLSFIFINIYGSGLTSSFTVPKFDKSIDTVQDLLESNMSWGATHDAWIYSIMPSTEVIKYLKSSLFSYCVTMKETL